MKRWILGLIFVLALFLRVWNLSQVPEAIDEDEMALGYYGYSLFVNQSDEYGNKFPLYFESAGDYKYGLYSYFAAIPVGILGLNPFSTRIVAALAGSLSVVAIYFLALEILKKEKFALLSAFVLAVAPTHIHFSRVAYNNVLGALFAITSIIFLMRWLRKGGRKNTILILVFYILAILSYQAYRVYMPIVLVLIPLILYKKVPKERRTKVLLLVIVSIAIVAFSFISPKSRARSQDFSLLYNKPKLIEQFTEDNKAGTSLFMTRVFHNKIVSAGLGFLSRYMAYFDPEFLFVQTTSGAERHSIPDVGLLYLIEAPLFLLGLLSLSLLLNKEKKLIPLALLFAGPVAASLVIETRSTTRAIIIVYAYVFIIALGIYSISNIKKWGKYVLPLVLVAYFFNFLYISHQYLVHKKYHHPWHSDVGLKEMVEAVNNNYDDYSNIVMSGGHYISYLFYNEVHPKEFIEKSDFAPLALANGVRVTKFDKIIFNMPYECPPAGKKGTLYVCFGYQVPQNASVVEVIRFRDEQPAIILVEFLPLSERDLLMALPERLEYNKEVDLRFKEGLLPDTYENYWPITK
jgi:4-amino-4-deoxy-L-arabinose transferase-like glycosyltransferase